MNLLYMRNPLCCLLSSSWETSLKISKGTINNDRLPFVSSWHEMIRCFEGFPTQLTSFFVLEKSRLTQFMPHRWRFESIWYSAVSWSSACIHDINTSYPCGVWSWQHIHRWLSLHRSNPNIVLCSIFSVELYPDIRIEKNRPRQNSPVQNSGDYFTRPLFLEGQRAGGGERGVRELQVSQVLVTRNSRVEKQS